MAVWDVGGHCKFTILFLLWSGKIVFDQGKVGEF